jgi:hypothetical protein
VAVRCVGAAGAEKAVSVAAPARRPGYAGVRSLGLVIASAFVVASVPALIVGGRWLRGFGTSGLTADEAVDASASLSRLLAELDVTRAELRVVREERDAALAADTARVRADEEASCAGE